ncbi:hypothetical protein ACSL103130_03600 [Actinomyces slackii]|uniref:DNA polymerase II n=1 Tax=Actinomyces slackii TaxID=52774 RepID=A0A448KGA8_9ACTO|nr:hypothetical protein [Actinomyces slackii]VEG75931.1 Uncharacterised protein [Actinomyces slackii]
MSRYTAANGTEFSDEDIERWARQAESEQSYGGSHLGRAVPGRPISVGHEARPFTLRLDAARRAKLDHAAQQQHTTPSQVLRDLIDTL